MIGEQKRLASKRCCMDSHTIPPVCLLFVYYLSIQRNTIKMYGTQRGGLPAGVYNTEDAESMLEQFSALSASSSPASFMLDCLSVTDAMPENRKIVGGDGIEFTLKDLHVIAIAA